jgi:ABC-2 type transport system permease protein
VADPPGKYVRCFWLGLQDALTHRARLLLIPLGAVTPIVIQVVLWKRVYAAGDPGGTLFGFTRDEMLAYAVLANLLSRLVSTGFEYELHEDIKSGALDRFLIQPIGYFWLRIARFAGTKIGDGAVTGLCLAASFVVLVSTKMAGARVAVLSAFAPALILALCLNFLIFWCVGLLGFWLTETGFLFEAVRVVVVTASGGIFPLAVLGHRAEAVLRLLPFRFTIQFPTEILCGRIAPGRALGGLALGTGWTLILAGLAWRLWRSGLRRFAALGS